MLDLRDSQFPEASLISDSSEAERVEKPQWLSCTKLL